MKRNTQWIMMALMTFGLLLTACAKASGTPAKAEPVTVEEIEGSDFKRVILTEKAAERLSIQTAVVQEAPIGQNETVVGEVLTEGESASGQVRIRVPLNQRDIKLVARDKPALVQPLENDDDEEDSDDEENGWTVEPDEALGLDDGEDAAVYYLANSAETSLVPGQRVFVLLPLTGSQNLQKAIPYAALVYDTTGGTYVYVKEPSVLAFVRQSVTVDYILGDLVYLTEGPSNGTEVVTVGVAELYGAETGVSK